MGEVSFTASVTRADDLLVLSFDFFNLELNTTPGQPARLVRITGSEPAFVAVRLAPQHVAEQFRPPEPTSPPQAVLANPTRLVFRLEDGVDTVDFTLHDLLDWGRHQPSLTANAAADAPADLSVLVPAEPGPTETAIELPYRLVLSPDATGVWSHAVDAVTLDGVSELWQTRLGRRGTDGVVDETQLPGLRAVWSRDLRPGGLNFSGDAGLLGLPLTPQDRAGIVSLSSFFGQEIILLDPVLDPLYYTPPALRATHLVLSALGGWTDIRGDWDFPLDSHQVFPNQEVVGPGDPTPLVAWRHIVAQGRDQYVRIVSRGFLHPLGHRADEVKVFERTLGSDSTDGLVHTETTVVVREAFRNYAELSASNPDHRMLLRTALITTLVTPPQQTGGGGSPFVVADANGDSLAFHVVGEDWVGRRIDLHMPLVFVPANAAGASGLYEPVSTVDVGRQPVALAPAPDSVSTSLPVQTLTFAAADAPASLPFVVAATVSVPAVDHLIGTVAPNLPARSIRLVDPATTGEVFATFDEALPVDLPPERAGGLARPSFAVGALSRSRGAVPVGFDDLPNITHRMFEGFDGARLLGSIQLIDVIADITDGATQLPQLLRRESATGIDTTFTWTPPLKRQVGPLVFRDAATLTLSTILHAPVGPAGGPPTASVRGSLTNFAINFAEVVKVSFDAIEFESQQGRAMSVRPSGVQVRLQEELEFLNVLAAILPADGFADGPSIAVTPSGVTAGYALGLPAAGIGIFSLENVALSAGVFLPFDGSAAIVRLAFSDRAHPFLVSVSLIGGAGFFALEVDTHGIRRIEAAIEIGANITIGLGIVSANVHVMAGFYFGLAPVGDKIDFSAYLRVGGSVELLGIAGISIEFVLAMTLDKPNARIGGQASVVVSVHLLMFSKSLTLSAEKYFPISSLDPSFEDLVTEPDWETYCNAFA